MPYKDPAEKAAHDKMRYQRDKEKILARTARYRAANRKLLSRKAREYYLARCEADPEHSRKQYARWLSRHPEVTPIGVFRSEQKAAKAERALERENTRVLLELIKQSPEYIEAERRMSLEAHREACRRYYVRHPDRAKISTREHKRKQSATLHDVFVRASLGLNKDQAPKALIEVKRAQLKVLRLLKELS